MFQKSIINADMPGLKFGSQNQILPRLGNPHHYFNTIPIIIKRYFTDVNGTIVNKALVPPALQVEYPFAVFGDYDKQGGYSNSFKALQPIPGTEYLLSFVNGMGFIPQTLTGFSGVNTVKNVIGFGDLVHVFTDDSQNPNYFVWIVQKNSYGSLGSIVGNSETDQKDGMLGKLYLQEFQYTTDNPVEQWRNPIHFVRSTNNSTWRSDQVQPYIFKTPDNEQAELITIKCEFNLDQFLALVNYFYFDTEIITWNFKIRN